MILLGGLGERNKPNDFLHWIIKYIISYIKKKIQFLEVTRQAFDSLWPGEN